MAVKKNKKISISELNNQTKKTAAATKSVAASGLKVKGKVGSSGTVSLKPAGSVKTSAGMKSNASSKAFGNSRSNIAANWADNALELYKQMQSRLKKQPYDAQFTPEYFENNRRVQLLLPKTPETSTALELGEQLDIFRQVQAGENYRTKQGTGNYAVGAESFALNDAINQNEIAPWLEAFKGKATQEDIESVLDSWKKSASAADPDSDYYRRTMEDIEDMQKWASDNFSYFAGRNVSDAAAQIAKNNIELRKMNTAQQDYELLSNEWAHLGGNDPVAVFGNNDELRRIIGYDELEAQAGGDYQRMYDSVLTRVMDILEGNAMTDSEARRTALENENAVLTEQMYASANKRDSLRKVEDYKKQVEAAFTTGAYNDQNIDPYKAYTEYEWNDPTLGISETRSKVNIPTFQQMIADPEGVAAEYKIAVGAGAPPGLSQQIDLVRQLSKEERAGMVKYAKEYGWDAAEEYFNTGMRNEVMRRQTAEFIERAKEETATNPILSNIAQVGYRVLGNLQNMAGGISTLFGGEPNQYNQFEAMADTTQETTLKKVADATPWANVTVGGQTVNLLGLVVQAGYAVADEATSKLLYGGLSPFMMALSSGSKQAVDVYNETGNRLTAVLSGAISGAGEYFSENLGEEQLNDVDKLADGVFKYIVANAAGESAEELLSSFVSEGGDFASHILTGEKNERQKKYEYYLNNGYDEGGALLKILEEFAIEAGQTAIVGAIAGAGMSAGNAAVNMPAINAQHGAVGAAVAARGNIIPLLKEGMQSKNRTAKRLSERLYNKLVENNGQLPDDAETNAEVQLAQEELTKEKTVTKQSESFEKREGASVTKPMPQQETEITKQSEPLEKREGATVTKPMPKANESAPEVKKQVKENQETGKTSIRKPLNKTDAQQNEQTLRTPDKRDIRQIGMVYAKVMKALDVESTGDMKKIAKGLRSRLKELGQDQGEGVSEAIAAAVKGKATPDQLDIVEAVAVKESILKDLVDAYGGLKQRVQDTSDMLVKTVKTAPESEKQAEAPEKKIAYADMQNADVSIEVDGESITAPISSFTTDGKGGVAAVVAGRIVPVSQLHSNDEGTGMLIERASQLRDAYAANAMMESYNAEQDVNSYADAFEVAYHYGQIGRNEVMARRSALVDLLSASQFKQAYEAGKTERASRPLARASAKGGEVRFAGDLGKNLRALDPSQKNAIKAMTRLTKFLGTFNVEYFESKADAKGNYSAENGSYDPRTNTIRIDINAGRNNKNDVSAFAMLRVASHELTHFMRAQNDEGYAKLMNFVANNLDKLTGAGFDASVLMKMDMLPDLDYDAAVEEVVADACEMMLKDSTAIQQFARENQTVFKKMLDWMRSFVENVRKAFIGVSADSVEAKLLSQAEGMQKLWDDALVKAMENVKARQQADAELDSETVAAIENDRPVTGDSEEKFSVRTDTHQFKRWFGDSKVVNPDGTPKVMYHGSPAQFTVFDKKKAKGTGLYGRGFYFTDSEAQAGVYGNEYAVYLKVENPLTPEGTQITTKQLKTFLNAVAENEDYSIENYGTYDVDSIAAGIESRDAFAVIQDVNATAIGDFAEAIQLFNEVNGTGFDGIVVPTETVVFEPTQIKSATDNVGTFDPENPDIRYSKRTFADGTEYVHVDTEQEYFAGYTGNELRKRAHRYLIDNYRGKVVGSKVRAFMKNESERKMLYPNKTQDMQIIEAISKAVPELGNLLDVSVPIKEEGDSDTHSHGDNVVGWKKYKTIFEVEEMFIQGITNIKMTKNGDVYYGMSKLKDITDSPTVQSNLSEADRTKGNVSDISIAQPEADVNKKFSRRTLTPEDRDMLMSIADKYATTKPQKELLGRYRTKTDELIDTRAKLEETRSNILRLQRQILEAAPGTTGKMRTERLQYENRAKIYETQINRLNEEIYKLLQSKTMQTVLGEVMDVVNSQEKARRKEFVRQYKEDREKTDVCRKIRAICDDFDRRLKSPTEGRYVPKELVTKVIAVRELINVNSDRKRDEKAQARLDEKIAAIKDVYERYRSDATYAYTFDETIKEMLGGLARRIGGKNIYQLSKTDLEAVYETLKALKTQVTEAVQLKSGKYAANIFDAGMEMHKETMEAAPLAKGALGRYLNWQLTPDEFFARLAGHKKNSMWSKVAKSFSDGTQKMLEIQREAYYHFRKWTESKEFDKLNSVREKDLIDIGLKDANGKPVKITKGMMLEIYMHMQSEDNFRAMMYGGLSVPNLKKYYSGKVKEAYGTGSVNTMGVNEDLYRLNEQLYADETTDEEAREILKKIQEAEAEGVDRMNAMRERIEKHLTAWDRGLIEAVHQWNDGKSRDYINDVTMDMYGIKKAGVKNYYTIRRDLAFVNSDFDTIRRNMNLENWGSLKERVPSKAPVLLGDIAFTMDNGIKQMSQYVGYARAQRDFGKLYNIRMPGMTSSVQKAVETKFGSGKHFAGASGAQYIENYIGSITGSRQKEGDFLTAIRRNLPRATMTLNVRVAVSQLSAIPKAAAEVGWGNMLKGISPKAMFTKQAKEELARKNAWFWTRYQGEGGQREFADMKGGSNFIDKAWNWVADTKVGRYLLNWNQNFDVMATSTMWNMARAWAKSNGYTEGTAKFDEAVNQKYTDIIRKTQAANTVSERSDLHRSNKLFLTMYKSEAFANFNLLYDSVAKWRKYAADLKAGKNGVTKADLKAAQIGFANALTSVVFGASMLNALIKLAVNAIMGTMSAYRDDEDEVTAQSTAKAILLEVSSDMAGMLAGIGDVYELFEAKLTGGYYNAPNDAALQELGTVLSAIDNLDADSDLEDWKRESKKIFYAATNMLGIPAKTVTRQADGIASTIEDIFNGEFLSFEAGVTRSTNTNLHRLANAEMAGDKATWDEVYKELQENYLEERDEELTEKEFISKFKEYIGKQYKNGDMSKEDATKLLKARTDVKDEHALFWQFDKWDYAIENDSSEGYAIFNRLKDAVATKQSSQIKSTAKFYMQHGYTEKDMRSEIESKAMDLYCDGVLSWNQALKILLDHCNTSEKNYDNVNAQYWLKDKWDYAKAHDGSAGDYSKYGDFYDAVENGKSTDKYVDELFEHNKSEKKARSAVMSSISARYKNEYIDAVAAGDTRKANQILEWALRAYEAIGLNRNKQLHYIQKNWVEEDE